MSRSDSDKKRPCIVCGAAAQLKDGIVPEIVLVSVALHGMAAGAIPGGRPSLCAEHDLVRVILLDTLQREHTQAGEPLAS